MTVKLLLAAVVAAAAGTAQAITVDGNYDPAYGAATASVSYDPAAPNGNFGTPGTTNTIAYSIFVNGSNGFVYTYLRADPSQGGSSVGAFNNLYFDLDPANGNGSDIGFELSAGTQNVFVAGAPGTVTAAGVVVAVSADQLGVEAAIPVSYFTTPYSGLTYFPGQQFASLGDTVLLRLSQSFGYAVAGGASYGPDRLGAVTLTPGAAVPEPATWGLLIAGFAMTGVALRRRAVATA